MKINNRVIREPYTDFVVIPRLDCDLVFTIEAIYDYSDFEKRCPEPNPPVKVDGNIKTFNTESPDYKKQLSLWAEKRISWIIITSLKKTDGLEWDTVNYNDPNTWSNYVNDLKSAFLTDQEITHLVNRIIEINSMNSKVFDDAYKSFLAGRGKTPEKENLQNIVQ